MLNKSPVVLLLFPLLLAGCHHPQPTSHAAASATEVDDLFASSPSAKPSRRATYAYQIMSAVKAKMPDSAEYSGQSCRVRLSLQRDGAVSSISAEKGDEQLCHAVISAFKQADIPAAPDDDAYQTFKNTSIDFKA
ncbi:TPA: cell envelope integrity protein TolA [Klebsiella aerogenes]|jgi:Membrane protein involved in colicin uptake|uniref:cell envelope integrity protein TolA n=1 Tax=Klebsiella TaxID=570 RepID=UPI00229BC298|nr:MULTISPECIES: cell envelope integrity protein TolA [Klebsiella]EKW8938983.1 cell envelope integrity protein TolA [Klebsiella aerogenes]EKW8940944.1 cell envelope integrity protein TolA [Klebsiella aerogenes]MDU9356448.1 cell envelope integrity protein TolA [Klebsiella sp. 141153]MDY0845551.1 cell envelope integrity protein TolA [Klebsiella aerogenes]WPS31421.1 cell envelope integrity protein TolA [Klebsiella aerogenes]